MGEGVDMGVILGITGVVGVVIAGFTAGVVVVGAIVGVVFGVSRTDAELKNLVPALGSEMQPTVAVLN